MHERNYIDPCALTEREAEVLALVAEGLSNDEIARRLGVHNKTVRSHLHHLTSKLGVSNRTAAAVYVWRERVAELEQENERLRDQIELPSTVTVARMFERAYARVLAEAGLNGTTTTK